MNTPDFDSLSTEVGEFEQQLKELQKKYSAIISEKLTEILKSYFDTDTECAKITWTQYTPFFNDGEECIFSVNEPNFFSINFNEEEYNGYYEGDLYATNSYRDDRVYDYAIKTYRPATAMEMQRGKLSKLLQSSGVQSVLKLTFGDHAKVTVTREGITSEEYDHD